MRELKNLLREILGELRMIHAELNALRAEQLPQSYTWTVPKSMREAEEWYETSWSGDTTVDES